ncbi:MAG: RepB family protein [Clostridium celatum]|nr:RepB family protein [Clostridium celatum]
MATEVVKEESIRVRIDKELKEKLRTMCDNKKITMSKFIINVIENEVARYEFNLQSEKTIESRIEETEKKLQKLKEKLNV